MHRNSSLLSRVRHRGRSQNRQDELVCTPLVRVLTAIAPAAISFAASPAPTFVMPAIFSGVKIRSNAIIGIVLHRLQWWLAH